ncbi:hypothetical protein SAR11G3_00772 [Candidatus Pelagibacter sp. IMCC9063]|nr:hypothetical protein SAR11G3_00772 [Candidatus Pelagibacter sp. IMCC9063]
MLAILLGLQEPPLFSKKKLSFCRWKIHSSGKAGEWSSFQYCRYK